MSVVTGLMIVCCVSDDKIIPEFRAWLKSKSPQFDLSEDLSDGAAGIKHPQMCFYSAGLNYFSCDDKAEAERIFKSLDWQCPENAVLLLKPEEGATMIVTP